MALAHKTPLRGGNTVPRVFCKFVDFSCEKIYGAWLAFNEKPTGILDALQCLR